MGNGRYRFPDAATAVYARDVTSARTAERREPVACAYCEGWHLVRPSDTHRHHLVDEKAAS